MFHTILLEGPEIVAITQVVKEPLENGPIPVAASGAAFVQQILFQVFLDAVVVQKRVVDVDKESDRCCPRHRVNLSAGRPFGQADEPGAARAAA